MANRHRQQQHQQQQQQQQLLQQHRQLPPSSELFASAAAAGMMGNIPLQQHHHHQQQQLQQQQLQLQSRASRAAMQAAAVPNSGSGLGRQGVLGNGSSPAAPPSNMQPLPAGQFNPQGGTSVLAHFSNLYASALGGRGQVGQQHRNWPHQQQHAQGAGVRMAGGVGRGGGSEFVGGHAGNPSTGVPRDRVGRPRVSNGGGGVTGSVARSAVSSATEVVEVLDEDRTSLNPVGGDTNHPPYSQQHQQQRQQQRALIAMAGVPPGVRMLPPRREARGLPRVLDDQLHPIDRDTPGNSSSNDPYRNRHPTGSALLRLLAGGQPHWYIGQEALPTGDRRTVLYVPVCSEESSQQDDQELDSRPRLGVMCESMSLKLLTGQAHLVEALAGMYMKSIIFFADEGSGEFPIPGAPQAFLPYERALYAAGMRDGDVVTLVDGLPASQGTLAKLGTKAHSQSNQPCVACVRLTFLRPIGASPTLPSASPQSVIDRWRELVRIIVLNSVPESARKQEVLEQLEKLQDASTLRTLACRSFEDQLMLARSSAERKARTGVSGPRNIPGEHNPNPDIHSNSRNINAAMDPAAVVAHGGTTSASLSWRKPVSTAPNGSVRNGSNVNNNGHLGSAISGAERFYNGAEGTVSGGTSEGGFVQPLAPNTGAAVVTTEAAPSAFVLRSAGHMEGEVSNGGPWHEAGAGSRSRLVLPSIESSLGGGGGGAMRAVSEGVRDRGESFSFPEMALVQEHWQDGVCTLRSSHGNGEDGEEGDGEEGLKEKGNGKAPMRRRRLVKCWGLEVKVGMTKAQLEAELRKAASSGTLPDSGCFVYDVPGMYIPPVSLSPPLPSSSTLAASVSLPQGDAADVANSSKMWCKEGQIVWVRGAFVAYVDGEAIEDNDVWCPGLVCVKMSESAPGEEGGDGGYSSPGFVVDVLGQSQAEFEVEGDNLMGFPGEGDNLETVRDSAESGLGSPPDHMSLAVGQAILACLKCGWDPVGGTNILRPSLCNDQDQGSARVREYSDAWGIDHLKMEELLKLSWQLMRPLPKVSGAGTGATRDDTEDGGWEHLRATWRKIERMWRSAPSVLDASADESQAAVVSTSARKEGGGRDCERRGGDGAAVSPDLEGREGQGSGGTRNDSSEGGTGAAKAREEGAVSSDKSEVSENVVDISEGTAEAAGEGRSTTAADGKCSTADSRAPGDSAAPVPAGGREVRIPVPLPGVTSSQPVNGPRVADPVTLKRSAEDDSTGDRSVKRKRATEVSGGGGSNNRSSEDNVCAAADKTVGGAGQTVSASGETGPGNGSGNECQNKVQGEEATEERSKGRHGTGAAAVSEATETAGVPTYRDTDTCGAAAAASEIRPSSTSSNGDTSGRSSRSSGGVQSKQAGRDSSSAPPVSSRGASTAVDGGAGKHNSTRATATDESEPPRGKIFEAPPKFNENDFKDRSSRANGGSATRIRMP